MKQTKEDKEIKHNFDKFSDKELMLNFRINLEKAKNLAESANRRSQDVSRDLINMENAMVKYLDRTDASLRRINAVINCIDHMDDFLKLPWYKRIFYKGYKNAK